MLVCCSDESKAEKYFPERLQYCISVFNTPIQTNLYEWYIENMVELNANANAKTLFRDYVAFRYISLHPKTLHLAELQRAADDDVESEYNIYYFQEQSRNICIKINVRM